MTSDYLLEYFDEIKIVRQFQDMFFKLCGLGLEIRKTDGMPVRLTPSSEKARHPFFPLKSKHCSCPSEIQNCQDINAEILDQAVSLREPQYFMCPAGLKKILIPIVLNDHVSGVWFTGENSSFRLE